VNRRIAIGAAVAVTVLAAIGIILITAPKWSGRAAAVPAPPAPVQAPGAERKIKATLHYISEDGLSLVAVQREVPFAEAVVEQARHLVQAQLASAPAALAAPIPAGTTLRALFLSERGDAFVDLSGDVRTKHGGGALDELFTVYAIVDTLTVNLPAITRVQILIDGKEAETVAGHVDIRHPLQKNLSWSSPQPAAPNTPQPNTAAHR
jgi:hypothetical protein